MNAERLSLQILSPDGHSLEVQDIDFVIVRRKEIHFELGSEVAIFPRHAPILVRIPVAPVRYRKRERTFYLVSRGGFLEVKNNQVLIVTPRFEEIGLDEPDPSGKAKYKAAQWVREQTEFQKEIVGYLL